MQNRERIGLPFHEGTFFFLCLERLCGMEHGKVTMIVGKTFAAILQPLPCSLILR